MNTLEALKVKIFADGADKAQIEQLSRDPLVRGFTTNPTLMRKAGVTDYEGFARDILMRVRLPISFEVFSDDFDTMYLQALKIASWADNVYVKIPITNTAGVSSRALLEQLARDQVKVNVTAIMTMRQVETVLDVLAQGSSNYVSVFAGRIADAGTDPLPIMQEAVRQIAACPGVELIWASPREVYNVIQADQIGCDIITVTWDLMKRCSSLGRNLDAFSLDTVRMFYDDAHTAGYQLPLLERKPAMAQGAVVSAAQAT